MVLGDFIISILNWAPTKIGTILLFSTVVCLVPKIYRENMLFEVQNGRCQRPEMDVERPTVNNLRQPLKRIPEIGV